MRVSTLETIAGRSIEESLGYVHGTALWSRRILKNKTPGLRALEHMNMNDVAEGLAKVREDAEAALFRVAVEKGADAVVGLRIELIELRHDTFQAVATGTAVRTEALPTAMPKFEEEVTFGDAFSRPANDFNAVVLPFQRRVTAGIGRVH